MMVRILLTADLHLGMKFAAYPEIQSALAEERFRCLERIVTEANARGCDILVIAGDLFERTSVARRDADRAAAALAAFTGRVAAVLPGNHDFLAPDDELWRRFREGSGDRLELLTEARPVPLEHYDLEGVCLYPGPCTAKHSSANAIGWVRDAFHRSAPPLGIGVAHGSLEGYSPDFARDYYPMSVAELMEAGPRLWLVGHTHLPFTAEPLPGRLVACAGTPEPDGFDCTHEGSAYLISVNEGGESSAETIRTGAFRFTEQTVALHSAGELEALAERLAPSESGRTLLRLSLQGYLGVQEHAALEEIRRKLESRFLFLDWRAEEVRRVIDVASIDAEFAPASFPHELLTALAAQGDTRALQAAYELLQEARR